MPRMTAVTSGMTSTTLHHLYKVGFLCSSLTAADKFYFFDSKHTEPSPTDFRFTPSGPNDNTQSGYNIGVPTPVKIGCHSFHASRGQQDELPTENLRLRAAAEELEETGDDAVSEALKTMTSGEWLTHLFTFPRLHTSAACLVVLPSPTQPSPSGIPPPTQTVITALDDSSSAKYAGFEDKEARRKWRKK
ncbi:hypothetical protein SCLCIDRAFT_33307 [Scleroderma citrinum Foug A]|uniref:Uncharacterized protein n=1 Tax=Scleroderma citrinum Foug A TaxID=1036808 RepID=A0A0C3D5G0_9AGAM|nr:hypothetical protein SCLCIDRAFT_33307 [Scleroderma citrinum Foug A]